MQLPQLACPAHRLFCGVFVHVAAPSLVSPSNCDGSSTFPVLPFQLKLASSSFRKLMSGRCPCPARPNSFASNSDDMIVSSRVSSSSLSTATKSFLHARRILKVEYSSHWRVRAPSEPREYCRVMLLPPLRSPLVHGRCAGSQQGATEMTQRCIDCHAALFQPN